MGTQTSPASMIFYIKETFLDEWLGEGFRETGIRDGFPMNDFPEIVNQA